MKMTFCAIIKVNKKIHFHIIENKSEYFLFSYIELKVKEKTFLFYLKNKVNKKKPGNTNNNSKTNNSNAK